MNQKQYNQIKKACKKQIAAGVTLTSRSFGISLQHGRVVADPSLRCCPIGCLLIGEPAMNLHHAAAILGLRPASVWAFIDGFDGYHPGDLRPRAGRGTAYWYGQRLAKELLPP